MVVLGIQATQDLEVNVLMCVMELSKGRTALCGGSLSCEVKSKGRGLFVSSCGEQGK